ncbi:MAG: DNA-directed RNA polymerase subunit beta, partial [Christensenellales bacterium]
MSSSIHKVKYGNTERLCFSKIKDVLDIPYLIEVQKDSYKNFIDHGIGEVFRDFSPIVDFSGKMELQFLEHKFDGKPKYTEEKCRERDATYAQALKVKVRLTLRDSGEIVEQEVFMGDLPLMTNNGSFIINGAERVIVSQLVRSPGIYCGVTQDKTGKKIYSATVIPNRGAWLEFEADSNDVLWVHVDRTRKLPSTILLKALGLGTNEDILRIFDNDPMIKATLEKDTTETEEDAKIELYKRLRPGEVPTAEGVNILVRNRFYDPKVYDLSKVGRYKFNKKLCLATRIENKIASRDVITEDGEVLLKAGEFITSETAVKIQNSGINEVYVKTLEGEFKVMGNHMVDLGAYIENPEELGIKEKVYYKKLKELMDNYSGDELRRAIKDNYDELIYKHIIVEDILGTMNYNLSLYYHTVNANGEQELDERLGDVDNIDHLANRRVRSVGELLQNQFRMGITRLERVIKERMSIVQDTSEVSPQSLINIRPVTSAIKEFFGSSQLSQFMDQENPIAELTHKRKLSALGPGGLNRERASVEVRDVHHSHYGRMCPIETPEGQNIGLISSLSTYARVNEYGFIESPYRKVDKAT